MKTKGNGYLKNGPVNNLPMFKAGVKSQLKCLTYEDTYSYASGFQLPFSQLYIFAQTKGCLSVVLVQTF